MLRELTIEHYLQRLASREPAPGGGSAAALTAAQSAALLSMAANLTVGKKKFAAQQDALHAIRAEAQAEMDRCLELGERDMDAFESVIAAYRLPQDEGDAAVQRGRAIRAALRGAAEPPAALVAIGTSLLAVADRLDPICNPAAASDVAVARHLAVAAMAAARENVEINLRSIESDPDASADDLEWCVRTRGMSSPPG